MTSTVRRAAELRWAAFVLVVAKISCDQADQVDDSIADLLRPASLPTKHTQQCEHTQRSPAEVIKGKLNTWVQWSLVGALGSVGRA